MGESRNQSPKEDGRFHSYRTSHIPWWIRAPWICFWIGAIWYAVKYLIPSIKSYF